jgi:hypothetical protein
VAVGQDAPQVGGGEDSSLLLGEGTQDTGVVDGFHNAQ